MIDFNWENDILNVHVEPSVKLNGLLYYCRCTLKAIYNFKWIQHSACIFPRNNILRNLDNISPFDKLYENVRWLWL